MPGFAHRTAVAQKNAVLAEDLADFREGDRVMTVDGFPGRVTGVLFGPYQNTESYQVELDNGMGGGDYAAGQLAPITQRESSRVEAAEVVASIPFEAVTDHTANNDYPELEDILERRLPNENIKIYAAVNKDDQAGEPDSSADDSGENLEQDQEVSQANPDDIPGDESDDPDSEEDGEEGEVTDAKLGDVTPPSACSYCGGTAFGDTQMTGRGVRVRCDQCGGTMVSWGGQWQPEFPNSSQNNASGAADYRSGGVGGIGNAPGAKPDSTSPDDNALEKLKDDDDDDDGKTIKLKIESVFTAMTEPQIAESLQSEAGIVQYLFNRIYEKARKNYEDKQVEWWLPPTQDIGTNLAGPAQYHTVTPRQVSVGSLSEYDDPEWKWHFTSSWVDVQAKARRFKRENHVKIVAASKLFVTAEVLGDTATYETQLNYVPGTRKVADWACGCKWASYAWGRSKRYQRFEGRLCSHALATQYEANARGIFGRDVRPDVQRPDWQEAASPVVVRYDKAQKDNQSRPATVPTGRYTFSSLVLDSDGIYPEPRLLDLQHPPVYASVQTLLDHRASVTDVIEFLANNGVEKDDARGMMVEALLSPPAEEGYPVHPGGSESASALTTDASKQHHHKKHVTNQEHGITWGRGFGPWAWCGLCGGSGCNNCSGTGQVAPTDPNAVGDGGAVDAGAVGDGGATGKILRRTHIFAEGQDKPLCAAHETGEPKQVGGAFEPDHDKKDRCRTCEDLLPEDGGPFTARAFYHEATIVTADYSTADPLAGMDAGQMFRPTTPHSTSENPASTGWATGQDPGDWGKSLISNDFGVTFDAALHQAGGGRHHPQNDSQTQFSYETGMQHGYDWATRAGRHADFDTAANQAAEYHEYQNPGMKYHYLDGFGEGAKMRNSQYPRQHAFAATEPLGDMTDAAADHLARMFDSTLHDTPEGALPSTDGADEEVDADPGAGNTGQMPGDDAFENTSGNIPGVDRYDTMSSIGKLTEADRIVAEFQMTAGAQALRKESMKDFSFEEQQELINEGKGARARNFGDLQIAGTHYALIGDSDDDETILWV